MNLSTEKAYLLGTLWGDAGIYKISDSWRYVLREIDLEFLQEAAHCLITAYPELNPFTRFPIREYDLPDRKNIIYVTQRAGKCLGELAQYGPFRKREWRVPEFIFDSPEEVKAAAIRGKMDSDACTSPSVQGKTYEFLDTTLRVEEIWPRIRLHSVNLSGLEDIQRLLKDFNIYSRIIDAPMRPAGRIHILCIRRKQSCKKYLERIGFAIHHKQDLLKITLRRPINLS